MDFQVSARKWRPQKFGELIGQEHIVRTLVNAVELDRVSHAYLFSGTRGVGKTTTARILAKVLNCEDTSSTEPCDECVFCREIRDGSSIDVQEIDGASNNSVAEVRDLIENVQYATSSCRYKVYIIDEVHMLSKSAFNALLKTLEEPPPKVVFIFATTELSKIPETILSRCQCFDFKPLNHRQIVKQLELICGHEKIDVDNLSLEEIAKSGAGSMRDAQSLLDQVVAYCGREINPGAVEEVLGIVGQKTLETFVDHVIDKDSAALLLQIHEIANSGKDLHYFCRDLVAAIRNLMMVKVAKKPETLLDAHVCNLEALQRQVEKFDADELQQMFNVLSHAATEMKRSSHPKMVFEMAAIRLTDVRPFRNIDATIEKINRLTADAGSTGTLGAASGGNISHREGVELIADRKPQTGDRKICPPRLVGGTLAGEAPVQKFGDREGVEDSGSTDENRPSGCSGTLADWERICQEIVARKSFFSHYLTGCEFRGLSDREIHLAFSDPYTLQLVEQEENTRIIREAVKAAAGREVVVKLSQRENSGNDPVSDVKKKSPDDNAGKQMDESEIIQEALEIFGGVVVR